MFPNNTKDAESCMHMCAFVRSVVIQAFDGLGVRNGKVDR